MPYDQTHADSVHPARPSRPRIAPPGPAGPPPPRPNQDYAPPRNTQKPPLHGRHWMAITGKPLAATAGAMIFQQGRQRRRRGVRDARRDVARCGTRSAGAARRRRSSTTRRRRRSSASTRSASRRPARRRSSSSRKGYKYPPEYGPLAAVTPGTPGGLMTMLAEYGTLSLARRARAGDRDGRRLPDRSADRERASSARRREIKQWPYSKRRVPAARRARRAKRRTPARSSGSPTSPRRCASSSRPSSRRSRPARRARRRSTPPTTASTTATSRRSSCAARRSRAACITTEDLANWKVKIEEPVITNYKGIDVYKLDALDAGPGDAAGAEHPRELRPEVDGLQQRALHPHALPGDEPRVRRPRLLLRRSRTSRRRSRCAACCRRTTRKQRAAHDQRGRATIRTSRPGDPYPFQGGTNPFTRPAREVAHGRAAATSRPRRGRADGARRVRRGASTRGTTSIEAADEEGWVVSVTPSGGWIPAVIAGRPASA